MRHIKCKFCFYEMQGRENHITINIFRINTIRIKYKHFIHCLWKIHKGINVDNSFYNWCAFPPAVINEENTDSSY